MLKRHFSVVVASALGIGSLCLGSPLAPGDGPDRPHVTQSQGHPEAAMPATHAAPPATASTRAAGSFKVNRVIKADVAAIDQPIGFNRLGSMNPAGLMFALTRDVVPTAQPPTVVITAIRDATTTPATLKWSPNAPVVRPGDTIEWRIGNIPASTVPHGTLFTDFAAAQKVLEITGGMPIKAQAPRFPAPAMGTDGNSTQGALLVAATVKAVPAGLTEVPFLCTIHGQAMPGKIIVQSGPQTIVIDGVRDSSTTPATLKWSPNEPNVRVGDTIEWRIGNIPASTVPHGTLFTDFAAAQKVLEITGGMPIKSQAPRFPAPAMGTDGTSTQGTLLVSARVKDAPKGVTEVPFLCTIHGTNMPGKLVLPSASKVLTPGNVALRPSKRPRPLTLRANVGDCLEIRFTNLLNPVPPAGSAQTRYAGLHLSGLELLDSIDSDASWVGTNPGEIGSLVAPGQSKTYRYYAREEGTFLIYSAADPSSTQTQNGLFGAVNVEPVGAEWYRSQVTARDLGLAAYNVVEDRRPETERGSDDPRFRVDDPRFAISEVETPRDQVPGQDARTNDPTSRSIAVSGFSSDSPKLPAWKDGTGRTWELRLAQPSYHTSIIVKAKEGPDGRLINASGHPIVNYEALYPAGSKDIEGEPIPEGTPVLSMLMTKTLKPIGRKLSLGDKDAYRVDLDELNAGIVPQKLVGVFEDDLQIKLSDERSVTEESGYAWTVIDQGRAWLVEVTPDPIQVAPGAPRPKTNYSLQVFEADLELVHSDITALITGPNADRFPYNHTSPSFRANSVYPDRRQPFREFTIIYHSSPGTQAFANTSNLVNGNTNLTAALSAGNDAFGINYGVSGIGNEILANRLGKGPMGNPDAVELKYEEFFLSSWSCADPAMLVDVPANAESATKKPTKAYFPDDPSNVYHSYMRDHVKFRLLHAGTNAAHVHHLHAHQWLYSPDSDKAHYLDSQLIVPGSAYTLEITYGGSGNRNLTPGDSIFHCHFYPHFAAGMWSLWRVHDVFEAGTILDSNGIPLDKARALPDGQIEKGTPIPGIVPLPSLAMAPIPAEINLVDLAPLKVKDNQGNDTTGQGRRVYVVPDNLKQLEAKTATKPVYRSPGYPFYIPGIAGHRPPHPPLDFAWKENEAGQALDETGKPTTDPDRKALLDGGLPRHLVLGGTVVKEFHTRWDFSKDFVAYEGEGEHKKLIGGDLLAFRLPEGGTDIEKAAMSTTATRSRVTPLPNGDVGNFLLNGLPPTNGAPYANPGVDDQGNPTGTPRRYKAAVIQTDVVLNKKGWHYPQQRFLSLWGDIKANFDGTRAPQPLFFRATTGDSIEFWHTNLVPSYYKLDDFQVRTPTDIIGQHIHLVKFDVTSSDGAANGFNYEDGTFSPDEVAERIDAINAWNPASHSGTFPPSAPGASTGLYAINPLTGYIDLDPAKRVTLAVKPYAKYYPIDWFGSPPKGQSWDGAQTTIQRWDTDPLLDMSGDDRTLRTVFTHDHFGPSTHQQVGLYGGLLVEPSGSKWLLPDGGQMAIRGDGGPTNWEGVILTGNQKDFAKDSFREFAINFQDTQLAYDKCSPLDPSNDLFDPRKGAAASAAFDLNQSTTYQKDIPAYVKALDLGTLPTGLADAFHAFGVPLTSGTISVTTLGRQWEIKDTSPLNKGATYVLRSFPVLAGTPPVLTWTSLQVYMPDMDPAWASPDHALFAATDPANLANGAPFPKLISAGGMGTYSFNYRNEPIPYRVAPGTDPSRDDQNLAQVFRSIKRSDPDLNRQPVGKVAGFDREFPPRIVPGMGDHDPYTPMFRAYQGDKTQVRTLVGAHTQIHVFQVHGVKWFAEPGYADSGYRNSQSMGISEHFEMIFPIPRATNAPGKTFADFFVSPSSDIVGLNNGLWGIMRAHDPAAGPVGTPGRPDYLMPLPSNRLKEAPDPIDYASGFRLAPASKRRVFNVTATTAAQAFADRSDEAKGRLIYNWRMTFPNFYFDAYDDKAVIYVRSEDLTSNDKLGTLRPDVAAEPLILRAAAGDWIEVNLTNAVDPTLPAFKTAINQTSSTPWDPASPNPLRIVPYFVPPEVGLHPHLISYDAGLANGLTVGHNRPQTVKPGEKLTTYWYAGNLEAKPGGIVLQTPVEFGTVILAPADTQVQHAKGLHGALIVEPEGSVWASDEVPGVPNLGEKSAKTTQASATVTSQDGSTFREFVVILQNDTLIQVPTPTPAPPGDPSQVAANTDSQRGTLNYRTESSATRSNAFPPQPPPPPTILDTIAYNVPDKGVVGFSRFFANDQVKGDPMTPVFQARAGSTVRFRVLIPGGASNLGVLGAVFQVSGHVWQDEPYTKEGTVIGRNPLANARGMQQVFANEAYNIVLPSAGGAAKVPGDYLFESFQQSAGQGTARAPGNGTWGILRVTP